MHDALVDGHQSLIPALELPDPDDRHVLAAAIRCGADLFLVDQLNLDAERVCPAMRQLRASLKKPPRTVEEYLVTLKEQV